MVKMHGLLPVPPFLLQADEGGRGEGEHEPGDPTMGMGPEVARGSQVGVRHPRQEGKEAKAGDTEEARLVSVLRGPAGCHSSPGTTEGGPTRGWRVFQEGFPGKGDFCRHFTSGPWTPCSTFPPPVVLACGPRAESVQAPSSSLPTQVSAGARPLFLRN